MDISMDIFMDISMDISTDISVDISMDISMDIFMDISQNRRILSITMAHMNDMWGISIWIPRSRRPPGRLIGGSGPLGRRQPRHEA
jgi:hypothetical protein